jgi:uncharacterized repeat protein (TIGR01451 family)
MKLKQLGLWPILLLLGVGITSGLAAAELTAGHSVPPTASVGQTVKVTVNMYNSGNSATQVIVTPDLPSGVVTSPPGSWPADLAPGSQAVVNYPIRAEQSGMYWIASRIAYSESGVWRELRLEAPFTAESAQVNPPSPVPESPGPSSPELPLEPPLESGEAPGEETTLPGIPQDEPSQDENSSQAV